MPKKLRVSAETITELRDFLSGVDVDMGCRPVALKRDDRYVTTVVADDGELDRISIRRLGSISVEVLEDVPSPQSRLRMLRSGNRFLRGKVPQGLGEKK